MYNGTDKYGGGITGDVVDGEEGDFDIEHVLATAAAEESIVAQVQMHAHHNKGQH